MQLRKLSFLFKGKHSDSDANSWIPGQEKALKKVLGPGQGLKVQVAQRLTEFIAEPRVLNPETVPRL